MCSLTVRSASVLATVVVLGSVLTGCPEKGAPADKTVAEPEQPEPDDQGMLDDDKAKKPASAAGGGEEKKADEGKEEKKDEGKEEGGW